MITIIHGTDIAKSRKFFLDLKDTEKDALLVEGQNTTLTDLVQMLEGGELFASPKNFFIGQLLSKKKKSRELDQIIEVLTHGSLENNIYLWEDKELTKAVIDSFKNPIIRLFKLPLKLFSFLENIKPKNSKTLITLFHQAISESEPEMVFFMIVRQIRILLALVEPGTEEIDEVKRIAPWQKGRLLTQADNFEIDELKTIYQKLFIIEKDMKTGNLAMNLTQTIDLLWLEI